MMIGINDRQTIREKAPPRGRPAAHGAEAGAQPPAAAEAPAGATPPPAPPADAEQQPPEHPAAAEQRANMTPEQARQAIYGPWEFHTDKWELAYIKRIDATIAALKSAGVPVIWVGPAVAARPQGQRRFVLSQRALSQPRREGRHRLCRHLGRLRRRGRPLLAARAGFRRPDPPPAQPATASISPSPARASSRTTSSAKSSAASPTAACRWRCRCRSSRPRRRRAKPGGPARGRSAGPVRAADGRPRPARGRADRRRRARPPAADATATRVLTKGEPIAAPTGRADDFSWPRGSVLTLEPATDDLATRRPTPSASDSRTGTRTRSRR